jgi:predicted RNA-binding Zn-ribbon protein involved in translation (DUF1610 family)
MEKLRTWICRDNMNRIMVFYIDGTIDYISVDDLNKLLCDETDDILLDHAKDILNDIKREERTRCEERENYNRCLRIADEIDEIVNNILYKCPHCGELVNIEQKENEYGDWFNVCSGCGGVIEDYEDRYTIYNYLEDCLDIEYITNAQKEYKAVKIWVTLGGPSICIDTDKKAVCLYWGGKQSQATLSSEACSCIDEWGESYFSSI